MDKFVTDQAEGLRRLLSRDGPQVIAVAGVAGAGRTTTVANLAAALAGVGRQVLVIDECGGGRAFAVPSANVGRAGRSGRFEAALRGELALADAIDAHPCGFGVACATHADDARDAGEPLAKRLADVADIVLIDARLDHDGALSPLALNAQEVLLVTRTEAHAITDTYACIKRLHFAHAIAQFRVVGNQLHHPDDARVLDNLVGVASRYLTVALERAGWVAADPHMARAVELARPIVDAFPSTAAARDFRRIAAELPHWPLRPALAAQAASRAAAHPEAPAADAHGDAARITNAPAVSTVTSIAEAAPARAGWQTGPSAPRQPTHHA